MITSVEELTNDRERKLHTFLNDLGFSKPVVFHLVNHFRSICNSMEGFGYLDEEVKTYILSEYIKAAYSAYINQLKKELLG
jgi:hypothetical protein